ncbi:WD40/YVTN/BNR-like repeat-containing protein [Pseudomonas silesiensis]|uniref:WD40/YVTN/BNR-like repeat-containing protein n=1 Tax=Pseudomonas silesiensis TaxID=1853130 RepID=UPI0034DA9E4D
MHRVIAVIAVTLLWTCIGAVSTSYAAPRSFATLALHTVALPSSHPDKVMLMAIALAGDRLVSVGENGTVALSDDHGKVWRNATSVPVSVTLTNVAFATATRGWAIGHQGVVLRTDDGGQTWIKQADGVSLAQASIVYWTRAIAAGGVNHEVELEHAQALLEDGPEKPLLAMRVDDEENLTVVGAFGIAFQSSNGGATWEPVTALENEGHLHLYGVTRMHDRLLMAGEQGLLLDSARVVPAGYEGSFFGIVSDGQSGLFAYGLRGNIAVSLNDAHHWQVEQAGAAALTCGLLLRSGQVLLCNQAGQVFVRDAAVEAFKVVDWQARAPLTGAVQLPDGDVVFSSLAGITRIPFSALFVQPPQLVGASQ